MLVQILSFDPYKHEPHAELQRAIEAGATAAKRNYSQAHGYVPFRYLGDYELVIGELLAYFQVGCDTDTFESMKNVVLYASVETLKALGTRAKVAGFLDLLKTFPAALVPDKLGFYEPEREPFVIENALERLKPLYTQQFGADVSFRYKKPLRGALNLSAPKGGKTTVSNAIGLRLDYSTVVSNLSLNEICLTILGLVKIAGAAYACATVSGGDPFVIHYDAKKNVGEIGGIEIPSWMPFGIKYLCGIAWLNVFGHEYIEFFGKETLTKLDGFRAEFIEDERWFWLQPTERPEDMWTPEGRALAEDIKEQLGKPNAFYDASLGGMAQFKKYDTPVFDFSEIRLP